jgi:hypothetical protein
MLSVWFIETQPRLGRAIRDPRPTSRNKKPTAGFARGRRAVLEFQFPE